MSTSFGLRTRVVANLAAAVSVTFGLLAVSTLVILRGAQVDEHRAGLELAADAVSAGFLACPDEACRSEVLARALEHGFYSAELTGEPGCAPCAYVQSRPEGALLVIERRVREQVLLLRSPVESVGGRFRDSAGRLVGFLLLHAVVLVGVGVLLFERGVVRRLRRLGEVVSRVEHLELTLPLITPEGDEIGRMGGAVRRMVERLRDERARTDAYIAELEQANRNLREAREGLARSERLATVGRLAAGVAHEIGNPLSAILGYLDVLRLRPESSREEYFERIEREARRIDRILRDLLDFSRPQPLQREPVSLVRVVDDAARLVQPQPRWRTMRLETDLPADLPPVVAHGHHLTQVLVNLLINAADACQGRGTVRVSARPLEGPSPSVELELRDDGPGIPSEDLGRVFDPFFTTKPPGEGTGLGLAISHRVMEAFGGSIAARNAETGGAVFVLRFKVAEAGAASAGSGAAGA